MKLYYDSKNREHKSVFGPLTCGFDCVFSVCAVKENEDDQKIFIVFERQNGEMFCEFEMEESGTENEKSIYTCKICFSSPMLLFYYFRTEGDVCENFYKLGFSETQAGHGEKWQVSCISESLRVPEWYQGRIMYQIFPDRFNKSGNVDMSGKLTPYILRDDLEGIPYYLPDEKGVVQNNDFFGGNLRGIKEKLTYLKSLNVDIIYLNPIFKAYSNHRYDTADYMKIDELLGTESDFAELCSEAHSLGMKIILDGVFSHTGSNSVYFDSENVFGKGACSDKNSPYKKWYDFQRYPDEYTSWWGIKTLPCVKETEESYLDYIIENENSVLSHWLKLGADGIRLDVADELPSEFINAFKRKMREVKSDSFLIGEVWEDASNKISYGKRREYFTASQLDSVMNYPYKNAIVDFVLGNDGGDAFRNTVMTIAENYPCDVLNSCMTVLSTHDTARIMSVLGNPCPPSAKEERAVYRLSEEERKLAEQRLYSAVFLQFVLNGIPCIYYGDEIGAEGYEDPFCRGYFRWDKIENNDIYDFYKNISNVRKKCETLKRGNVWAAVLQKGVLRIERFIEEKKAVAIINVSESDFILKRFEKGTVIFEKNTEKEAEKIKIKKFGFILVE